MAPFLWQVLNWGLRLVCNAALVKGTEFIKVMTGVDLEHGALTEHDRLKLAQFEQDYKAELLQLQREDNKLSIEESKTTAPTWRMHPARKPMYRLVVAPRSASKTFGGVGR